MMPPLIIAENKAVFTIAGAYSVGYNKRDLEKNTVEINGPYCKCFFKQANNEANSKATTTAT